MTFHHKKPSTTFCEILLTEILSDRQSFMTSLLRVAASSHINDISNTETLIQDFFHGLLDILRVLKLTAFMFMSFSLTICFCFSWKSAAGY